MGNDKQTSVLNYWTILMLEGTSFLHILLQEYGHDLDSGIILIAENDRMAWQLEKMFVDNADAKSIPKLKENIEKPFRYQMGIHVYKKSDKLEAVIDFLHRKNFLPMLIVGGVVPDGLSENAYVIKFDATDKAFKTISRSYQRFKRYVLDNIKYVKKQLMNLKVENALSHYDVGSEYGYFLYTSMAVGKIWKCYMYEVLNNDKNIKENEVGKNADVFFEDFMRSAVRMIKLMEDYATSYDDIPGTVRDCLIDYLERHRDVVMQDISNIKDDSGLDKMILYDDGFYYIKNTLFSDIFSPLLETISTVQLKRYMQGAGMLQCDNTKKGTYTPKVSLHFPKDGSTPSRHRFIKIIKGSIQTDEGLSIEDHLAFYRDDGTNDGTINTTEASDDMGLIDSY